MSTDISTTDVDGHSSSLSNNLLFESITYFSDDEYELIDDIIRN